MMTMTREQELEQVLVSIILDKEIEQHELARQAVNKELLKKYLVETYRFGFDTAEGILSPSYRPDFGKVSNRTVQECLDEVRKGDDGDQLFYDGRDDGFKYERPDFNPFHEDTFNLTWCGLVERHDPKQAEKWKRQAEKQGKLKKI